MINNQPGYVMFCRLVSLLNGIDDSKNNLRLSFPEKGIADIDHINGQGIRLVMDEDLCQVVIYEDDEDSNGTWMTVSHPTSAAAQMLAYLNDFIPFTGEAI